MNVDGDSTKSESTLTSMSYREANGSSESTIPKSHCSINMPGELGIIFKISREIASRRPLSYLKLSQVAYGKIKQGNKIEFFDCCSIAYMTIKVHRIVLLSREDNIMYEDEQVDGSTPIMSPNL